MTALLLGLGWLAVATSSSAPAVETPQLISSDLETAPVFHSGDAMDDPAVWVHPTDPSQSLVMGNDKGGGLETYALDGHLVQRLEFGTQFWGNVDVRQGVTVGTTTRDLVGAVQHGVRFYTVDPATRLLSPVTEDALPIDASVPDPAREGDAARAAHAGDVRRSARRASLPFRLFRRRCND